MNLAAVISAIGAEQADKIAVIERERSVSYGELHDGIASAAARMRSIGVASGDRVAIALPNGAAFLSCLFGSMLLDATAVPIRYEYCIHEVGHILENASPRAVVCDSAWLKGRSWIRELLPPGCDIIDYSIPFDSGAGKQTVEAVSDAQNPALISYAYTGAGEALGAVHSHLSCTLAGKAYKRHVGMQADDRILFTLPMPNAFTLAGCVFAPLLEGATLVVENDFTPKVLLRAIANHQVTILTGVPAIFRLLATCYRPSRHDICSLRMLITGGDYMPENEHLDIEQQLSVQMVQGYGLTECFPVLCNRPDDTNRPGTLGVTGRDVEVKIVDDEGKAVDAGVTGEIFVKTTSMMTEYYNRPERTALVYDGTWLHTGDLGHMDAEGYIHFDGLKKNLFNIHGNKVDPGEVRSVLLSHPSVVQAKVVCDRSSVYNGSSPKIRACVSVVDVEQITAKDIREFCKERIAVYKVPSFVDVLEVDKS